MTDRRAIWVFLDGGPLDKKLCDIAREELLNSAFYDDSILTQEHLANIYGWGRKHLIRTAQALGITDELKKILKAKRESRKSCTVCGAKKMHSENVQ